MKDQHEIKFNLTISKNFQTNLLFKGFVLLCLIREVYQLFLIYFDNTNRPDRI